MQNRILYIEDEVHLSRAVKESLERKGYEVLHRKDGTRILAEVQEFNPNVCLLDVMLPRIDGFTLGSMIRSSYPKLPIIFLTAKSQTSDVIAGFSSGGTDYLKKPFSMDELVVRIQNQIHLADDSSSTQLLTGEVQLGSMRFIPSLYELHFDDSNLRKLTYREVQLLSLFVQYSNRPIERRLVLQTIWGDDSLMNSRNLDVYVRKLRDYLSADKNIELKTLKRKGYQFIIREAR